MSNFHICLDINARYMCFNVQIRQFVLKYWFLRRGNGYAMDMISSKIRSMSKEDNFELLKR